MSATGAAVSCSCAVFPVDRGARRGTDPSWIACRVRATVLWDFLMVSGSRGSGTLGPRISNCTEARLILKLGLEVFICHTLLKLLKTEASNFPDAPYTASCPVYTA